MYRIFFKRLFDIAFTLLVIPFFIVLLIPISILIKLEDKGPIFYNANRLGQNGKLFRMYKFRSMKVNAPDIRLTDGSTYNAKNDFRVTRIGKFIRETSIDEIPQIINILLGQMSWIGPRPDPPDWINRYPEEYVDFLEVKPGITGYNQAYFRNSADGYEKMRNDKYYADHICLILDIKIFFKTITSVVMHKDMYKEVKNNSIYRDL